MQQRAKHDTGNTLLLGLLRALPHHMILLRASWLAFLLASSSALPWSGGSGDVKVNVANDLSYEVLVGDEVWMESATAGFELMAGGRLHTNRNGLRLASAMELGGSDEIGAFTSLQLRWLLGDGTGDTTTWTTTFSAYDDGLTLMFEQHFDQAVHGFAAPGAPNATLWGSPGSAFPSFSASAAGRVGGRSRLANATLGYISHGEIGTPRTGVFPTGYKTGSIEEDGVPLTLFDGPTGRAAILSPISSFYDVVFNVDRAAADGGSGEQRLRCGVIGTATYVPTGFRARTILHVGSVSDDKAAAQYGAPAGGITATFMSWGDTLLRLHNRSRPTPEAAGFQVTHLGYSSVGHFFYGIRKGSSAADTLVAVAAAAAQQGVPPFGYFLIDSWWYREGSVPLPGGNGTTSPGFGGTWRWDDSIARVPYMFPNGIAALSKALSEASPASAPAPMPLVMHMGQWVGSSSRAGAPPYSNATAAVGRWVVEAAASLPRAEDDGGFWDWLFAHMAAAGLKTFKLDHTQTQIPRMNYTLTTVGATERWLRHMAEAAHRHGVSKMFGGHLSTGFLHSLRMPGAHVARVSDDYIPAVQRPSDACGPGTDARALSPRGNVLLGPNSLYPWALGIYPYKDAFLSGPQRWNSTTCFQPSYYTMPEWWGLQEAHSELHAVVATLTAGPIAVGDGIGDTDPVLIARTCRVDGLLLKHDRPAFVVDAFWHSAAFRPDPSTSTTSNGLHVTQSSTSLTGAGTWRSILSVALDQDYVLKGTDLGGDARINYADGTSANDNLPLLAWRRQEGDAFVPPHASDLVHFENLAALRLDLPSSGSADGLGKYTLWHTAPVGCAGRGFSLLGELGKFVHVSPQRIKAVRHICSGVRAGTARGQNAMVVELAGVVGEHVQMMVTAPNGTVVTKLIVFASETAFLSVS